MTPAEDLLITFDDPPSGHRSPFKNSIAGLGDSAKFDGVLDFSRTKNTGKADNTDSSLYQPWWSQPIANSYPGSGTESPSNPYAGLSLNALTDATTPSQVQSNIQDDKEILIKKIKAHQEVLKRKLNELEVLRKEHEKGVSDCHLLKNYTENLLASKAVRNLN